MPLLEMRGISRVFPGEVPVPALRDVSLLIPPGGFVAIEGPSGGGKSTLLNILGLLDAPTGGSYLIDGIPTSILSMDTAAALRSTTFAFVFQGFHLLDRRPVIDSVELGLLYQGVPAGQRRQLALAALDDVGLGDRARDRAATLSGGQRQRIAIARALASGSPVVLADEPTGNLDSENSRHVVDNLLRLNASGTTVVLVTHSPEVAACASTRVTIRDGRVHVHEQSGTPPESIGHAQHGEQPGGGRPRLRMRDLVRDAAHNLQSKLNRTTGLAAAVGVGVALFVGTMGVSGAATAQVSDAFDAQLNREVTVAWNGADTADQSPAQLRSIPDRLQGLSGVDAAGTIVGTGQMTVRAADGRPSFDVDGFSMTPQVPRAARLAITWSAGQPTNLGRDEVAIGRTLADKLELRLLDARPIIMIDGREAQVVGVIEKSPRIPQLLGSVVEAHATTRVDAQQRVQAVILTQSGAAEQVARQAPLVIDPYDPEALDVAAPADPLTLRNRVQRDLQQVLLAFTLITVLASIGALANSMVMSVLERKHEFGLRRAVGAASRHVSALVLVESLIIGAVGGVVGLVAGLAGVVAITLVQRWAPVFDLALVPVALAGGAIVGMIGGVIAARHAAKIPPHEALRS